MIFKKGQRVRLTEAGKLAFPMLPVFGIVAHDPMYPDIVSVLSDNHKIAQTWHIDFWKPVKRRPSKKGKGR